jgi:CRP-like cAMP-binding protein
VQRCEKPVKNQFIGLVGCVRSGGQRLAGLCGADETDTLVIRDKMSRQDIAKMVGASREMVSRVMKDFEEQGFIQLARRRRGARI